MHKLVSIVLLVLTASGMFAVQSPALGQEFTEGVQYKRVTPEQPTVTDTDKIEVVEAFWYGCPHCHRFQPFIERWLRTRPDNIEFVRLPAILRDNWAIQARAFYTAETLGILEKIHRPLFDEIHNHKRHLDSEESLAEFFATFGVDKARFGKIFNSFAVSSKVRRARELSRRYNLWGTPSLVVNGKYRTDPNMVQGDYKMMLAVVDYLVHKESKEK